MKINTENLSIEAKNMFFEHITYEKGERVPWFVIQEDSVLRDEDGNNMAVGSLADNDNNDQPIVEWCNTKIYNGLIYAQMDGTSNTDGVFDGAEPMSGYNNSSYGQERQQLWKSQFGHAFDPETEMKKVREVANMWTTLEGSKTQGAIEINKYFDAIGALGFDSDCLGETKHFDSDTMSVARINGLVTVAQQNQIDKIIDADAEEAELSWKESGIAVCYPWTSEQIIKLGKDLAKAIQILEHQRELVLEQIENCEAIKDVKAIVASLA